jgi:DUF1680 family protein
MTSHAARVDIDQPVSPRSSRLRPLGLSQVQITDGYWADLQRRNGRATIPHIEYWLERSGWLPNFDAACEGRLPEARRGREFSDSEVYKLLEAMSWELGRAHDPDLETRFHAIVERVASAQDDDGYLSTMFGRPGQAARWSDLEWGHELYCIGHLIQAAVARARTGHPDDKLVQVARRAADLVCAVFGPDGVASVDGHPEIEPALVELYRVTGDEAYLDQAELFIDRRGHGVLEPIEFGAAYFQDDMPLRDADVFRGHAVRAMYLASGAVDLADERADEDLRDAVLRQWRRTIARRTYITGGMGSRHQDEAFGEDFFLPPDRAYSETCAGVGSIMLAWRLLLAYGDPAFSDLIERTLYNVVSTSPSADGRAFFYANTLHRREPGQLAEASRPSLRASSSLRAPWFAVSCCPTNVARTLASVAAYVATADDEGLQLHQYVSGDIQHRLHGGRPISLSVTTDYPHEGLIRINVNHTAGSAWTLSVRVPSWAVAGATLSVNGAGRPVKPGMVAERREWQSGDEVVLQLPMHPRFVFPDERVDAVRGCLAVERGPIVHALESVDLPPGMGVDEVRVDTAVSPRIVGGRVVVKCLRVHHQDNDWPFRGSPVEVSPAVGDVLDEVPLVEYHSWANRGPSTMRVWIPAVER